MYMGASKYAMDPKVEFILELPYIYKVQKTWSARKESSRSVKVGQASNKLETLILADPESTLRGLESTWALPESTLTFLESTWA